MKRSLPVATFFLCLLFSGGLAAQTLVPVAIHETAGAHGSLWTSEHHAHNHGDETAWISPIQVCQWSAVHACDTPVPAGRTISLGSSEIGRPFEVWSNESDEVTFSSFVRNIASDVDPWGTSIPTVHFSEFFTGSLHIAPVPADPSYRVSLRIYGLPSSVPLPEVDLEFWVYPDYSEDRNDPRLEKVISVPLTDYPREGQLFAMLYAEQHNLFNVIPGRGENTRVMIRVTAPLNPSAKLWALASITENDTQHVTVYEP